MKVLILLTLLITLIYGAPLLSVKAPLADRYIVVFHDNVTQDQISAHINKLTAVNDNTTELLFRYTHALNGYAMQMPLGHLRSALNDPLVKYIEPDQMMYAIGGDVCVTQANAPSWGIKRISLPAPVTGNTNFYYPDAAGSGVTSYIIDTGIYIANNDFGGRASFAYKATASWSDTDGNGHGTHVASTVGGTNYGVAKKCTLKAVKVLGDNGSGTNAGVIAGVDFTARDGGGKKSTANMSLGGGFSQASNDAVNNCQRAGVVVAVAAGNDNANCANYSPASATDPLTVGSTAETNSGGATTDTRSSFSNYGPGIDVFAPGTSITAAWIGNVNAINTISGTSMASPHVCGVATVLVSTGVAQNSAKSTITSQAKTGLINLNCSGTGAAVCNQSPNRFLYLGC